MQQVVNAFLMGAILTGISSSLAVSVRAQQAAQQGDITVDYRVPADYPLVKSKFSIYNSGYVRLPHYARDSPLFDEVNPDALRIDLAWGAGGTGWTRQPIAGTAENLTFDWEEMDAITPQITDHLTLRS